ncbi:uncharacterized protein PAC_06034 [Phialocephala subalpina]|uniref:Uncharacterized protein n=1 Tax=Phialocephala subalpina TaxID=576137 RepID=A0A1L7WTR1_9HELO|nr:uncharacterized protein PAC_06034 [Phialocephala subalpina]
MSAPSRISQRSKSLFRPRPSERLRRMPAIEPRPHSTAQDSGMMTFAYDDGFKDAPANVFENAFRAPSNATQTTEATRNDSVFDGPSGGSSQESPTTPEAPKPFAPKPDDRPISLLENVPNPVSFRDSTSLSTHPALRSLTAPSTHEIHPALRNSIVHSTQEPFPAFRNPVVPPKPQPQPQSPNQPLTEHALRRHSGFPDFGNPFSEQDEQHGISTISNHSQASPFEDIERFPGFSYEAEQGGEAEEAPTQVPNNTANSFRQSSFRGGFTSKEPAPSPDCIQNLGQKLVSKLKKGIKKIQTLDKHLEDWTWNRDRKRLERRRLSQKHRESSARAKSIDEGHRAQMQAHLEKEKARNERARRQLKESEKVMKAQSKNRDRAASQGSAASRSWLNRVCDRAGFGRQKTRRVYVPVEQAELREDISRNVEAQRPALRREGASLVSASVREVEVGSDDESASSVNSVDEKGGDGTFLIWRTEDPETSDHRYQQSGGWI